MENVETTSLDTLCQFINKCGDDRQCLELLRFFGTYPRARFNKLAVIHALNENGSRSAVERALTCLIDKGIVTAGTENNARLYSLTAEESIRRPVLELARLEWHQWHLVLRQAYSFLRAGARDQRQSRLVQLSI